MTCSIAVLCACIQGILYFLAELYVIEFALYKVGFVPCNESLLGDPHVLGVQERSAGESSSPRLLGMRCMQFQSLIGLHGSSTKIALLGSSGISHEELRWSAVGELPIVGVGTAGLVLLSFGM